MTLQSLTTHSYAHLFKSDIACIFTKLDIMNVLFWFINFEF